jgi:hypothetical protein
VNERPCRKCGMKIAFAEGPNGKQIPLQKIRNVYYIAADDAEARARALDPRATADDGMRYDAGQLYVSHFETCPNAAEFSRGRE